MSTPSIAAPPAPTPAPAPAPTPTPTPAPTPTPTPEPTPTPAPKSKGKGRHADGKSFSDRLDERFAETEALAKEAKTAGKTIEQLQAEKLAAKAAEEVAAKAKEMPKVEDTSKPPTASKEDELSDDAFKAQISEETKGMDPSKSESWAKLRYSERALKRAQKDLVPKTQLEETQRQLEAAKQTPQIDPAIVQQLKEEVAALKKRDADREVELTVAKVERTDAFKNGVTAIREKVGAAVDKLATKYELKSADLMAALTDTSDNQSDLIEGAIEKMNTLDKQKFLGFVGDLSKASETETTLRANAKEALAKIEARTSAQTTEEIAQEKAARETAVGQFWSEAKNGELKDVLVSFEGETPDVVAWNQSMTEAEAWAKTADFESMSAEDEAAARVRAGAYPLIVGMLQSKSTQLSEITAKYEDALKRLSKFEDNKARGDSTTEKKVETDPAAGKKDFVSRVGARIEAEKAAGRIR